MRKNRKKLEDFSITRKEFKIYWWCIEPYPECVCTYHRHIPPSTHYIFEKRYGKRRNRQLRPYHNRVDKCRYGNSHKSWKNYRKTQYRVINI